DDSTYRQAFAAMREARIDAVLLGEANDNYTRGVLIAELALAAGLPAILMEPGPVRNQGLMSYQPDLPAIFRMLARYTARILNSDKKSGDLPVWLPDRYELVVNLRTAKALGLTLPETITSRADEVIE